MNVDVELPSKCMCIPSATKKVNVPREPIEVEVAVPSKPMHKPHALKKVTQL